MKLKPVPFNMMLSGQKTIELRLYDEKRQNIKVGDKLVFTNTADSTKTINAVVVKLNTFSGFEELYNSMPLEKCGYTAENINKAHFSDMEEYYSKQEQSKYGVVGIELCVIK